MQTTQTTEFCPVMGFMVLQALNAPVTLYGVPGLVHLSPFHDNTDRGPTSDELFDLVFGTD